MGIFNQGLILMVTGMVSVFIFLTILIFVVKTFEWIAPKIAHILPDPAPKQVAAPKKAVASAGMDPAVAVAIAVAMKRAGR